MRIVRPGDPDYDADRQIANARFDYRPFAIYYCSSAADVGRAIHDSRKQDAPVRIRSGGHQHEGMCTADGALLIDLSEIHSVDFLTDPGHAWIGAGANLNDVYLALWHHGSLFSGGGCGDVHVGGLAQGGGWGPVARQFGLTCDSLVAVEMVDAEGSCHTYSQDGNDEDRNVLWALRGGGGGNFGVVTRFCFRLHPWPGEYTDILLTWSDAQLADLDAFVHNWVRRFPDDSDDKLTTFLRLSVLDGPTDDRVVVGGRYLAAKEAAQAKMNSMLAGQPSAGTSTYTESKSKKATIAAGIEIDAAHLEHVRRTLGTLPGYQPGPASTAEGSAPGGEGDLSQTCAGIPLRHKISSGFAREPFGPEAVHRLTNVIRGTPPRKEARRYVSLHCLGGAIRHDVLGSSFAFRDRRVLLQYQAWWEPKAGHLDRHCIEWIEQFRGVMQRHTDGAFINFVDYDIPLDEYYGSAANMRKLKLVKRQSDPNYFFRFQMSIPPA